MASHSRSIFRSKFDSSRDRGEQFSFNIGKSEVIIPLDEASAVNKRLDLHSKQGDQRLGHWSVDDESRRGGHAVHQVSLWLRQCWLPSKGLHFVNIARTWLFLLRFPEMLRWSLKLSFLTFMGRTSQRCCSFSCYLCLFLEPRTRLYSPGQRHGSCEENQDCRGGIRSTQWWVTGENMTCVRFWVQKGP